MSARTYVVALSALVTVGDDGAVTAEVDMSEADDLWSGEPDYPTGVVDADIRTIAAAVAAGMLRPEPSLHRFTPGRISRIAARDIALGDVLTGGATVSHVDRTTIPGVVYVLTVAPERAPIVLSHGDPVLVTRPLDQQMDGVRLDDSDDIDMLSTPTDAS